jgi:hypothetical protein
MFGEPELDRALQRAALSPAPETAWCSPPYGRGKSAPHANSRQGRREPIVSSSPSPAAPQPPAWRVVVSAGSPRVHRLGA